MLFIFKFFFPYLCTLVKCSFQLLFPAHVENVNLNLDWKTKDVVTCS